ncbi:wings apart-like protein regulation of heterochromatin domain-containing protein [Hirsutella rhossiliensis]|uniref:Wings apart-like protein regulation of heterochromatin domain-containing protein n=1 Tax=Hirsutella rhossiliensis TaxID=111463 RepID=A0A9P8MYT0_9HYPO|nr:wings apart-like protein regulation of heterochromatin domain-containing protein [Hirsutella rhossiliensis]KAH0964883.1 wings apart-like protein regulation of heterochromatin domain-containing protein [Hirsutella rhossiliensis]
MDLNQDLVPVAADCAEAEATSDMVDYTFAVFALEVLSSAGVTTGSDSQGPSNAQLPRSIAIFLGNAMQRWPLDRGDLEAATLKLAINTTNTEHGAAAFANADLLSLLADRIGSGYRMVQNAIGSGPLEGDFYDELVLLLGVMINIVEHSPPARASVRDEALDGLVALWHGNRQTVSEVSVALGYLAVLLGYLCLTTRGRERIKARFGNGEGIQSLVGSIRDFVAMYKTVDSKVHELEALVNELRSHDARGK